MSTSKNLRKQRFVVVEPDAHGESNQCKPESRGLCSDTLKKEHAEHNEKVCDLLIRDSGYHYGDYWGFTMQNIKI